MREWNLKIMDKARKLAGRAKRTAQKTASRARRTARKMDSRTRLVTGLLVSALLLALFIGLFSSGGGMSGKPAGGVQSADSTVSGQVTGTPADSQTADISTDSQTAGTPTDSQTAGTPADSQTAGTPADSQIADISTDSQTAGTPTDSQTAGTPESVQTNDSADSGTPPVSWASPTPEPVLLSSATLGVTGDILIHMAVLDAFNFGDGIYFQSAFADVTPYFQQPDLMVANLEVPLINPDDGFAYSSNPFASPDSIASALKEAGVDICTTANNHAYDMWDYGLLRTQDVLDGLGLAHIGTRRTADEPFLLVRDVNGIRIGMTCYTYETGADEYAEKTLNGIPIPEEYAPLIHSFDYNRLEDFYAEAADEIRQMESLGCEAIIFFLHWGEEYEDTPNDAQQEIAKRLCDLGVSAIIGGHPHVVQKYEVLESENGHRMPVLYSTGNALSNQRKEYMGGDGYRGYTEDGVVFYLRFDKYSDGRVLVGDAYALPTWVELDGIFRIIPLDPAKDPSEWPTRHTDLALESYHRTVSRLWDG